jgi:hypothetical protein
MLRPRTSGHSPATARPALEVLPWKLSDEAIDLVDEWLTWYMRRQLPEDGTLHQFRQIVLNP